MTVLQAHRLIEVNPVLVDLQQLVKAEEKKQQIKVDPVLSQSYMYVTLADRKITL